MKELWKSGGNTVVSFPNEHMAYARLMYEVMDELKRAQKKFPGQSLPWGGNPGRVWGITGPIGVVCQIQRAVVDAQLRQGTATWFDVIAEEFYEAGAESGRSKDPGDGPQAAHDRLHDELIQLAAMALRACADLDNQRATVIRGGSELPGPNYRFPNPGSHPMPPTVEASGDLDLGEAVPGDMNDPYDSFKGGVSDADEWALKGGKHSGNCQCKGCAEPEEPETYRGAAAWPPVNDEDLPPNAGSAS